ncbi:hypothetical protein GCM10022291_17700 [Postechiella marina]|uniref:Uncharacterized protein n=1 Tax=Postechiella marina TaxID=943941 RepID=A0ABP8C8E7_9FLAO
MKKYLLIVLVLYLIVVAFKCESDDGLVTQEDEQTELSILKTEIETLANTSICNETTTCKFIAFGDKPCGGPWSYLLYSTSINTNELENLVEVYNKKEKEYNTKWGVMSNCAIVTMPTNVECENNHCVAVY